MKRQGRQGKTNQKDASKRSNNEKRERRWRVQRSKTDIESEGEIEEKDRQSGKKNTLKAKKTLKNCKLKKQRTKIKRKVNQQKLSFQQLRRKSAPPNHRTGSTPFGIYHIFLVVFLSLSVNLCLLIIQHVNDDCLSRFFFWYHTGFRIHLVQVFIEFICVQFAVCLQRQTVDEVFAIFKWYFLLSSSFSFFFLPTRS